MSTTGAGTTSRRISVATGGTIAWFVLMVVLGRAGTFASPAGTPPVAVGLAAALPPVGALALLGLSHRFRGWGRTRDLHLLTTLQAWRTGGLAFLALAAVGALPLEFALPAGLGDVLVGITAPIVATLLARGALGAPAYLAWTAFGVVDLVLAVTLGVLYSDRTADPIPGEVTTRLMSELPMSIVPTFFVPFLLTVHVLALAALHASHGPGNRARHEPGARTATLSG